MAGIHEPSDSFDLDHDLVTVVQEALRLAVAAPRTACRYDRVSVFERERLGGYETSSGATPMIMSEPNWAVNGNRCAS